MKLPGGPAGPVEVKDSWKLPGSQPNQLGDNPNIGSIISALLPYIMSIAGLILFFILISGGFTLLTSNGNPESVKKGQQQIVAGIIGFVIIFTAYWLIQLVQIIFGVKLGFGA